MPPMSLHPSFQLICFIWAESVLPGPLAQVHDASRCLRLWQFSCVSHCAPLLCLCVLLQCFSAAPIDLSLLSFASLMRLLLEFCSPGDMIMSSLFIWLEFPEKSFQCFVFNILVFKSAPVLGIFFIAVTKSLRVLMWRRKDIFGLRVSILDTWSQHCLPSVSHKIVEENIWPGAG